MRRILMMMAIGAGVMALMGRADARMRCKDLKDPHKDFTQRGFQVYAGLGGQSYTIEDRDFQALDELKSRGMFFFGMGIGLDRAVSLFLEGNGSDHTASSGNYTFGMGLFGIKYAPNSGFRHLWQPCICSTLSARTTAPRTRWCG